MEITLANSSRTATIDDADYELAKNYTWWEHKASDKLSYAYGMRLPRTRHGEQVVKMHRLIMGYGKIDGLLDHKDGNGLNNQRNNLELITVAQNLQKADFDPTRNPRKVHSKFRGVSYLGWHGRYLAYVNANGKREYLGYFDTDIEAAKARDARAKELHGKYVRLNFENS